MGERYLLPASILSGANFNVYPQFSRTVLSDRVASLKASGQPLQRDYWRNAYCTNIKSRPGTHKIYTQNLPPHSLCNYTNKLLIKWILNPNKKIRHSCSCTVSIIIAFWIYTSFTNKRRKVVFSLNANSTGQINLVRKYRASPNEVKKNTKLTLTF